jgi:hypothetical protein
LTLGTLLSGRFSTARDVDVRRAGTALRRNIFGIAVILVGVSGTLGMIGRVFDAIDGGAFVVLAGFVELSDAFLIGFGERGELLCVTGLAGAANADFSRIVPEFVQLRLVVSFQSFVALGERIIFVAALVSHGA